MSFTIEECSYRTCSVDLGRKLQSISDRLEAMKDRDGARALEVFAERFFRTIASTFLEKTPEKEIFELLKTAFEMLRETPQGATLRQVPGGGSRQSVFVIHCHDAAFLVDTVQQCLKDLELNFQILGHPIFLTDRRSGGFAFADSKEQGEAESLIVLETEALGEASSARVTQELLRRLEDALCVHQAQPKIRDVLEGLIERAETENLEALLAWLSRGNFWFFSYRAIDFYVEGERARVSEGPLGLQLDDDQPLWTGDASHAELPSHFRQRLLRKPRVLVETVEVRSTVLNSERLTQIALRETLADGSRREHIFFGLFSEKAVDEPTLSVPVLRERVEAALRQLEVPEGCHDHRKAVEIFNTFPKVELFFMDADTLQKTARSFAYLYRSGSVKVVFTRSLSLKGLTLLLIMPRDFYSPENYRRMEPYLLRFFQAPLAASRIVNISGSYLSLHVRLTPENQEIRYDVERLERGLTRLVRPWEIRLKDLVQKEFGSREGKPLWDHYAPAFSREYKAFIHPRFALRDIIEIQELLKNRQERFALWGPFRGREKFYRLQFYSLKESSLNDLMPLLVNMHLCVLDEVDFSVRLPEGTVYIKSFALRCHTRAERELVRHKDHILEALNALYRGELENDYLNRLLMLTGLSWKEIDVFRGYRNYYFQLGSPFTKKRVAYALIHNPEIAVLLYRYFEARFSFELSCRDDIEREERYLSPLRMDLAAALEKVSDINEDRILRTLFNLIDSTVRTNYFIRRDRPDYFFSFKISAIGIMEMPAPRPLYEIYVHSNLMEGIHLRGGKVARGGIRWSDRPDDFRTEILGLMKTQMTKNALIVPVGSKGGFIVKSSFKTREEGAELSKDAYKTLMRGLLDLTDNRVEGRLQPAEGVVAYDEPDPYLVVAADKGTAHLPDTANSVSAEYGFWLGDSFASGGSSGGYDHKKLGITARGAWESVKRHFREMGHDTQSQPFTVVGIGDMSGDVFGNGMLLSRHIKLKAAFNHRHIFLDPNPDPEISFRERQRLFELPRSSWEDYDASLISKGGGVFDRSAKDIPLSEPVRRWLGVRSSSLDGEGLIRLLLTSEVDLLWNGGIGTYVKASTETDEQVGDRSNDAVRIDAADLKARVVGEGGNLGLTQRARIEYALAGGRINTDAVDNSAGVDTSDHEVNLKIFMGQLQEAGEIETLEERNRKLETFTEEVCDSVLMNNYTQGQCISLDSIRCRLDVEPFLDLADRLSHAGLLDRKGEYLPSRKEILTRIDRIFARPELAVLMSYAKMSLYQALLQSDVPRQEVIRSLYLEYFPEPLRGEHEAYLFDHPLATEITATVLTNRIVDQAGAAFLNQITQSTGASLVEAATAYLCFDLALDADALRREVYDLDNRLNAQSQYELLQRIEQSIRDLCYWSFELGSVPELSREHLDQLRQRIGEFGASLQNDCSFDFAAELSALGVEEKTIDRFCRLDMFDLFVPILALSNRHGLPLADCQKLLFSVQEHLELFEVLQLIGQVPIHDGWDRKASESLQAIARKSCYLIARRILSEHGGKSGPFWGEVAKEVKLYKRTLQKVRESNPMNLHPYILLVRGLEGLAE